MAERRYGIRARGAGDDAWAGPFTMDGLKAHVLHKTAAAVDDWLDTLDEALSIADRTPNRRDWLYLSDYEVRPWDNTED